jgi:Zn-dependent M32 family carboxypeptidase
MNRLVLIHLLALLALLPAPALAQGQGRRQQMEERIRARFGEQVRRELGLTEEQFAAVQQVEASFQEQRLELVRRESELRRQLRRDDDTRTEEQALTLLQEMAAVRADEAQLFQAEMDAFRQTLTADQLLRFYELRDQLMERVRRLRQGSRDRPFRDRDLPVGAPREVEPLTITLDVA